VKVIVDGRNCLDVAKWQGAGWRVHALGRNLTA
jgi:UDPglucose 6-dehydrogenase